MLGKGRFVARLTVPVSPSAYEEKLSTAELRADAQAELVIHPVSQTPAWPNELLLHELQVHQIELEMQNEALQRKQQELDAERKCFFDLYDLAPVGYCIQSEAGLILQTNLTASTMLGVERSAMVKQPFCHFILRDDLDIYYEMGNKSLQRNGNPRAVELRMLKQGGAPFWARLLTNGAQDASGASVLRIVITDISAFKAVEHSLKQSALELRAIIASEPECVKQLDRDGCLLQMNRAGLNMIEADSLDQVIGQDVAGLVTPPYRNAFNALTQDVFQGKSGVLQFEIVGLKGTHRWLESHAAPLRDERGHIISMLSITRDVSERQRMDAALHKSEAELKSILESTSDGILAIDHNGKVILFNQRFGQLWRLPQSLLDKRDDQILLNHVVSQLADPQAFVNKVQALYACDFEGVDTIDFKDGRTFERFTAPIHSNSSVIGRIWSFRDITERKNLEDHVRQLAFHDSLTQLANRRLLLDRLNQAMSVSKRSGNYGAVMALDLDNFKSLNDTCGHLAGDLLLVEVARRLVDCVREIDTVARVGGDEFVVLIGELDADKADSARQAAEVAEKIRASLVKPYRLNLNEDGQEGAIVQHCCTASIGVVLFLGAEANQADVMKWADSAMYRAKDAGRNLVYFHDETLKVQ